MSNDPCLGVTGQHISSAAQYTRPALDSLITTALRLRTLDEAGQLKQPLRGMIMTPLFFENSSRTYCSFVAAFQKLGGGIVPLSLENSSLASKGESLFDTIKTADAVSDVIVLRHPQESALETAMNAAGRARVINAGNGAGEHPTQALLDAVTIFSELNRIDGLHVVMVGDLRNGRTVHSLCRLLTKYHNMRFTFVAPAALRMPEYVTNDVKAAGCPVDEVTQLTPGLMGLADVVYVTRVQKERFASQEEYESVKSSYCVNAAMLQHAKPPGEMCVMHPLPRNEELDIDVDPDPRAAYFRQMRCGLYARMALLVTVLGKLQEAL